MSTAPGGDDRAAIENLYARYNQCADGGDAEGWASCFTDDGVIRLSGHGIEVRGNVALVDFQLQSRARRGARLRRHWHGTLLLDATVSGVVRGRCYFQAFEGEPGEMPALTDCGIYEDRIVQVDGGWRFAERDVHFDASRRWS
jgi:hypothetical protein